MRRELKNTNCEENLRENFKRELRRECGCIWVIGAEDAELAYHSVSRGCTGWKYHFLHSRVCTILQFEQIHFPIWTNTFFNLYKYILQFVKIYFVIPYHSVSLGCTGWIYHFFHRICKRQNNITQRPTIKHNNAISWNRVSVLICTSSEKPSYTCIKTCSRYSFG